LNNELHESDLDKDIIADERVTVYRTENESKNVGYHKHQAFHCGTGDVLVEIDSDDLITPDCLEELNIAYQDPEVGFAFSDVVMYQDDFVPYNPDHGWTQYPEKYKFRDKEYIVMNSWRPTSQALAFIWYAPDHVRSWRKDVYTGIGGHNEELSICDDHDLMIRTYLVTKMHHIAKPLYIYRVTGDNTWLERNEAIQRITVELANKYSFQLAEKDADDRGLLKVDMGGGLYPKPGYMTVDQADADIICNLDDGIPLPDNSVGVLNASHVIEHLKDPIKTMREIHRVLAHGGWAMIEVPSTDGRGAWQDPTHVSFWNEHSFWYYTNRDKAVFIRNNDIRFQTYRLETWESAPQIPVVTAWLVAIKEGERFPGVLGI
jgi:SAM-dependent methyltransferase